MNVRVALKTERIYKDGRCPLFIRFSQGRQSKYITTGIAVRPDQWDSARQRITDDCSDALAWNAQIAYKLAEYDKKIRRLEALEIEVNFDTLFESNGRRLVITIEDGFKREIERLEALGKCSSASKHKSVLVAMNTYKPTKMALEAVDMDYLKGFELFLRGRGNKSNSIATRFAVFKAIYNKTVKEGQIRPKQNPFVQYKVGSLWIPTRKRSITKEDIQKIIALEIPYDYRSEYKRLSKDLFLFSYFTAGMNFNDIARLRYKDVVSDRVNYSRHKTGKLLSFRLTPQATEIMERYASPFYDDDDYIFPIFDKNVHTTDQQKFNRIVKSLRKVNYCLKAIGEEIGLPFPLTTYVARHTFATVLKRSGVNIAIISESLGHSDLATTQIYLDSFENSQIDEAMKNLL